MEIVTAYISGYYFHLCLLLFSPQTKVVFNLIQFKYQSFIESPEIFFYLLVSQPHSKRQKQLEQYCSLFTDLFQDQRNETWVRDLSYFCNLQILQKEAKSTSCKWLCLLPSGVVMFYLLVELTTTDSKSFIPSAIRLLNAPMMGKKICFSHLFPCPCV